MQHVVNYLTIYEKFLFCNSYIRYSQICANAVRQSLKKEYQEAAAARGSTFITVRKWEDGKPVGNYAPAASS